MDFRRTTGAGRGPFARRYTESTRGEVVTLGNDELDIEIVPGQGGEVRSIVHRASGWDPLLHVAARAATGDPFLDRYRGGWQEIVPNGGPASAVDGVAFDRHGDVALRPWQVVELGSSAEGAAVKLRVHSDVGVMVERRMRLDTTSGLKIEERLTNLRDRPVSVMWGHHIAFDPDAFGTVTQIETTASEVIAEEHDLGTGPRMARPGSQFAWPVAIGPDGADVRLDRIAQTDRGHDLFYLRGFDRIGAFSISGERGRVDARWDGSTFPWLWMWTELGGDHGPPWWGQLRTVALEPWSSAPSHGIAEAVSRGTSLTVRAAQVITTWLDLTIHARDGGS